MKNPQIISIDGPFADTSLVIWGYDVIDHTTQDPITSPTTISVDIDFFNVTTGLAVATVSSVTMTYKAASGFWSIPIASVAGSLADLNKYVAKVTENGVAANMREFYLDEFAVDDNSFEGALMRLPFRYSFGTPSYIIWYTDTSWATPKYRAEVYEGSTGTTAATDASKVTHRGPIEVL